MAVTSDAQTQLLQALGESSISNLSAGTQARLLAELNGVMQMIYGMNPGSWWAEHEEGNSLNAPATLSNVTVTAGSKVFSGGSPASWMNGCTVRVSGQTTQNRIFQTGASTWSFLLPHDGATESTATITVYHDCLNMADDSMMIVRPVLLEGIPWELTPVIDSAGLRLPAWCLFPSHNPQPSGSGYPAGAWDRQTATPTQYYVDAAALYGGEMVLQIRLNPLPDKAYQIRWMQKEKFTPVTAWNDSRTVLIPKNYEQSVLWPLLRKSIMDLPGFQLNKDTVREAAGEAMKMLDALSDTQAPQDVFINATEHHCW